ncbi:MAG: FG-GAP repeat domain-containing protein [Chloroflexota bacterium]
MHGWKPLIRLLVLLVFLSTGCATPARATEPLFVPAPPVAVGPGSGQVLLADLNCDGQLDMVTRHLLTNSLAILLGDGRGRFASAPGSPLALGYPPGQAGLGDVNGDRILDLGVTSSERDNVDIFLGDGAGSFSLAPGSPFAASASTEWYTRSLNFVDIDEDGDLDVVTAHHRRDTLAILLGDGRGRFSPGQPIQVPSSLGRYALAFGDLDGDGHLDLVTASRRSEADPRPGRVAIQRGDGTGAFQSAAAAPFSMLSGPRYLTLADVDRDGRLDIVTSHGRNRLHVLLNGGDGNFAPAPTSPYNLSADLYAVLVADVNRDQKNDLLAATVNGVTVLLGHESGFAPAPGSPFPAGPGAYNLTLADVNRDGKLDIAAASFEGNAVTLLLGQ